MFIISTRTFPPEVGGMQNLMGGLAEALINHGPVKVFADKTDDCEKFDKLSKVEIERFGGVKLLRKYRKANRVIEYIENNKNIRSVFFDHWKSIEKINSDINALIHHYATNPIHIKVNEIVRTSIKYMVEDIINETCKTVKNNSMCFLFDPTTEENLSIYFIH